MPSVNVPPSLRRFLAALTICAALTVLTLPAAARADTLSDYNQDNAALEDMLAQRQAAEAGLQRWSAAEQASLDQLAKAETKLHTLLADRADVEARQPEVEQRVADSEAAVSALAAQQADLQKRVDAMDAWLEGDAPSPRYTNVRGYQRAKEQTAASAQASAAVQGQLQAAHDAQQSAVDQLGRDNTEITAWQSQAEALATQVGSARERALRFSGQLASIQKDAADLIQRVQTEFGVLRAAGYPVGVAKIVSAGPPPIAEPVAWPETTPAYALPVGKTDASLVSAGALFTTKDRLAATGVIGDPANWQAPIRGVITTPFGDATPYQEAHYALDIAARLYTPIVAAADGVVQFAGLAASDNRLASYGLVTVIRHNEHVTTLYAHMDDRANGLAVKAGDQVAKGQVIGYVGLTGYSTGPHLHFEVRVDNQPIDPALLVTP